MWNLPDLGIEPVSPALEPDSLPLSHQGSPREHIVRGIMVNWNNMQGRMTGVERPGSHVVMGDLVEGRDREHDTGLQYLW